MPSTAASCGPSACRATAAPSPRATTAGSRAVPNTYAALYNATCQRDWSGARARNFEGTAEAALHPDNVPVAVLETLIRSARDHSQGLRRYHALRKRALGLERYLPHDTSISIRPEGVEETTYSYDEACRLSIDAVAPLGQDYQGRLKRAAAGRWIDVYETRGKRSGAYSAGVYGVHPYILLNYTETLDDVFTLTHELGHTLHSVLSEEHQPFATAGYTIFVAEVASTLNEALLLDSMLRRAIDPWERIALLQHAIGNITSIFFAQVLFADFELQAHRMVERGEPITAESLGELYVETPRRLLRRRRRAPPTTRASPGPAFPTFSTRPSTSTSTPPASPPPPRSPAASWPATRTPWAATSSCWAPAATTTPWSSSVAPASTSPNPAPVEAVVARLDELVAQLDRALDAINH